MTYNFECNGNIIKLIIIHFLAFCVQLITDHFSRAWFQEYFLAYFKPVVETKIVTQIAVFKVWNEINDPDED